MSPVKGLIDFHTHAAPDVMGRAVDDDELASLAATREMEAIVFKNHITLTADRARLARKHVAGIKVFGGIVLNRAVGGINPQTVEWMRMNEVQMKKAAAMGAKMELCAFGTLVGPEAHLEWMRDSVRSTSCSARTSARRATRRLPTASDVRRGAFGRGDHQGPNPDHGARGAGRPADRVGSGHDNARAGRGS